MTTKELRRQYVEFFKARHHSVFDSDSLVPKNDPTLLFTSAGMNQFKDYFLGKRSDVTRAVSCQKCLRTGDLERVGRTAYHHTFFEMLGNFSFGDYFKKEAVSWAWEFVTGVLNVPQKDIWVTVYQDDDEARVLWRDVVGVAPERIVALGAHDNFWPQNALQDGPDGPCGPCSEMYFDRGAQFGEGNPGTNSQRFVEFWNLVFTQFNRTGVNTTVPLPAKNIDTGMGLERMASILQGKLSNFEIDSFAPLTAEIRRIIKNDSALYVHAIADHLRSVSFSIADGIYPSNEDRGYVVRKILRRAVWFGFTCGVKEPFVYALVPLVVAAMQDPYKEIADHQDTITKVIRAEEERFLATLDRGRQVLVECMNAACENQQKVLSGAECFKLYDTYGFPCDLTESIVTEKGLAIDRHGFDICLAQQKEASRQASKFEASVFVKDNLCFKQATLFTGYDSVADDAVVQAVIKDNALKQEYAGEDEIAVVLDVTPFYPMQGGQMYDTGCISGEGFVFKVDSVEKAEGVIFHRGRLASGVIRPHTRARAAIDIGRRSAITRAHTATHLLQAALRAVLGNHVQQQGSLVDEDCIRFDFNHFKGMTTEECARVEEHVNECIFSGIPVRKDVMDIKEAKDAGALAFFEEKYESKVRVITAEGVSRELCGGTHLDTTAQAGLLVITAESSVASGIRRIEALTGKKARAALVADSSALAQAAQQLKSPKISVVKAVKDMHERCKQLEKRASSLQKELFTKVTADDIAARGVMHVAGVSLALVCVEDAGFLRDAVEVLVKKLPQAVIAGYSVDAQKASVVIARAESVMFDCKQAASAVASSFGASGGGKNTAGFCGFKVAQGFERETLRQALIDAVKAARS